MMVVALDGGETVTTETQAQKETHAKDILAALERWLKD